MKKTCTLFLAIIISLFAKVSAQQQKALLPNEFNGYKIIDSVLVYSGNQLYNYIDGGAEIFMEYGFKEVTDAQYAFPAGQVVQAEIYNMTDAQAAYGAFTFYINSGAKSLNIGTDASLNSYYLAFWKNNLLVVITSTSKTEKAIELMVSFGRAIEKNITGEAKRPVLISKLIDAKITDGYLKYIRGAIGLSNFYNIAPGDAFQFQEAAAFELNGCKVLLINKENNDSAKRCEEQALQKMKVVNKTVSFETLTDGFAYNDYRKTHISCQVYKNFIMVLFNPTDQKNSDLRQLLISKLNF